MPGIHNTITVAKKMIAQAPQYMERIARAETLPTSTPSAVVEYGVYIFMSYTMLGGAYGIAFNNLASGLLILLFLLCLYEVGVQALSVTRIIAYPLGLWHFIYIHPTCLF